MICIFKSNMLYRANIQSLKKQSKSDFVRLRRRPRACPWMNVKMIIMLGRDVAENKADNRVVAEEEDG